MRGAQVLKLLAMRLRSIGERLGLKRSVGEAVYALLQHCLAQETHLFFLRHIDQLLLCAIYGVCKVRAAVGERSRYHLPQNSKGLRLNVPD